MRRATVRGCAAAFLAAFDFGLLVIVGPSVDAALGLGDAYPWLFSASSFAFGGLLMAAGQLTDRFEPARVMRLGLVLFAAGGVAAATAHGPASLVAGRVLTGGGAAIATPAALALLAASARARRAGRDPFATLGAAIPIGFVSGACAGAVALSLAGWRAALGCDAAVAAALALAAGSARPAPPPDRIAGAPLRAGAPFTLLALGVAALAVDAVVGCAIVVAALVVLARETTALPAEASDGAWVSACLAGGLITATGVGASVLLITHLDAGLGRSPLLRAAILSGFAAAAIPAIPAIDALISSSGALRAGLLGLAAQGLAIGLLAALAGASLVLPLAAGMVLFGAAHALANAAVTQAVLARSPPDRAGWSSAVLGTAQYAGGAAGPLLVFGAGGASAGLALAGALAVAGAAVLGLASAARRVRAQH